MFPLAIKDLQQRLQIFYYTLLGSLFNRELVILFIREEIMKRMIAKKTVMKILVVKLM